MLFKESKIPLKYGSIKKKLDHFMGVQNCNQLAHLFKEEVDFYL